MVLFCHVEAGAIRDRTLSFDRRHEEGVSLALPRILEFAEEQNLPIALALMPQSLRLGLPDLSGFTVGLHLHPQDDVLAARLPGKMHLTSDCLARYSVGDQSLLISAGAEAIKDVIGRAPTVFVAGNWSENRDTVRVLEQTGFRHDGSPIPGFASACADWSRLPRLAQPYHPSHGNHQIPGDSTVIAIPVFRGYWGDYLSPENLHYLGVRYFEAALKEASCSDAGVVHIYFHSPMALDPFFLTEFRRVLEFARDRIGARFVPAESIAATGLRTLKPFPPAYMAYLDPVMIKSLLVRTFPTFAPERRASTRRA